MEVSTRFKRLLDRADVNDFRVITERYYHSYEDTSKVLSSRANTGFFSNCTHSLRCLIELANCGILPSTLNFSESFRDYKNGDKDSDLYSIFFRTDKKRLERLRKQLNVFQILKLPDHHGVYRLFPYAQWIPIIATYFNISDQVNKKIQQLEKKYSIDYANTLAVCFRGTDKHKEVTIAEPSTYIEAVYKARKAGMKVLIQTDQTQIKTTLLNNIADSYAFDEMPTTSGDTVLHRISEADLGQKKTEFGITLLAVASIISKCELIVNHTGNMAAWICLFRGNARGVTQIDKHGRIVGMNQMLYGLLKNRYRMLRRAVRGDLSCYT